MKETVTWLFIVDGILMMASFGPTWWKIWKSAKAEEHSLMSWVYWTVSVVVGTVFSIIVIDNTAQTVITLGLAICHILTLILIVAKQYPFDKQQILCDPNNAINGKESK